MSSTKINEFDLDPSMDMAKQTTLQEVNTNVSGVKTDVSGVKTDISNVKNDLATVKSQIDAMNSVVANMSGNIAPRYRADDYLVEELKGTYNVALSGTGEIAAGSYLDTGSFTVPSDTYKIQITCTYTITADSGSGGIYIRPYLSYEGGTSNFGDSTSVDTLGQSAEYNSAVVDTRFCKYNSMVVRMYVYNTGSSNNSYKGTVTNIVVRCYGFKRVVTSTLYEANSMKSYGYFGSNSYYNTIFSPAPRLDRVELNTQNDYRKYAYMSDYRFIRTVDGIPYLIAPPNSGDCSYTIYY